MFMHWQKTLTVVALFASFVFGSLAVQAQEQTGRSQPDRPPNGDGSVEINGELMCWHRIQLTLDGPFAREQDDSPNPFLDYRFQARFEHEDGTVYEIPGYFATDGSAANSSAESGTKWRVLFAPDRVGTWQYSLSFHEGKLAAIDADAAMRALAPYGGVTGNFEVSATDKTGRDLRGHGRLKYVGQRYLRFAETGKYFLKVGADAPETLLAFADFDNTVATKPKKAPLKKWQPHVADWQTGDPTWQNGKGKGLIGAVNYLSSKGCNAFSFLTYNAGGDGDNVWPFIERNDKLHYDVSKLDQWGVVFDHATSRGMFLHFKMQETENDDNRHKKKKRKVQESLDGGELGTERKLYCRELVARFGHNLALNWNLGEENTQSFEQQSAMLNYIDLLDAYDHLRVVHTYPSQQEKIYGRLLGGRSRLTGASLQNSSLDTTHQQTCHWVERSIAAGKPWVVAFDESGSASHGQCPDLGYRGFDGRDKSGKMTYTQHEVRKKTLWGNLMGGGAGCEYYFGYKFAENDLLCEDWRSRDQSWDYCRIAINFFHDHQIPLPEMGNADSLIGNPEHDAAKFCLAQRGQLYLVYLPNAEPTEIDLSDAKGGFQVFWFNPRTGGDLRKGSVKNVVGGGKVAIGDPPVDDGEDWLVMLQRPKPPVGGGF